MTKTPKIASLAVIACLWLASSTGSALAERPDSQGKINPQTFIDIYAGKTWIWSQGGSYWAKDGSFQATVKETAIGTGKWYVTSKGTLCYEATWHSDQSGVGKDNKRCWKHVVDSEGRIWKQDMETNEWYRPHKEFTERLQTGNKIRRTYKRLVRKYGI